MNEQVQQAIAQADLAIRNEDFDRLMEFYTDDAVLVVKPGMVARGKEEIRKAFVAIARYFANSLVPTQGKQIMLEAGDTVLVLSQTLLSADKEPSGGNPMDRRANLCLSQRKRKVAVRSGQFVRYHTHFWMNEWTFLCVRKAFCPYLFRAATHFLGI